jgi:hypothetical protein
MMMRSIYNLLLAALLLSLSACIKAPEYGSEAKLFIPGTARQTWAIAPAVNLSGVTEVDPILQADLLYAQVQQTAGLNVLPVNRVVEVFAALKIEQVESEQQAAIICDLLGADALLVATITAYDPYDPPKMGASLHLFRKGSASARSAGVDPRELVRRASPKPNEATPPRSDFVQVVGMFDAANGSTRAEALSYAQGRNDPTGPYGPRGYLIEMDRYCGFVYHSLIEELLLKPSIADAR